MSSLINGKVCYPTVGCMSRSGSLVTLKLYTEKADADAVYTYFVDGQYVIRVGLASAQYESFVVNGWYQRSRSSVQMQEAYAEITLVFDTQNVQGLTPVSGSSIEKYDPVYSLATATEERPIEQHPRFKCFWAYNLYELVPLGGSASAVPAWAATDTNPGANHAGYLWSRSTTPPPSPDAQHEYVRAQPASKPGRDSYLFPRPAVTSTVYYRTRSIDQSDIVVVGQLKAPGYTYIYGSTATDWLVTGGGIQIATDELMAVTTTYQYLEEGWDLDIYDVAGGS